VVLAELLGWLEVKAQQVTLVIQATMVSEDLAELRELQELREPQEIQALQVTMV
jgi:hypothetical protein